MYFKFNETQIDYVRHNITKGCQYTEKTRSWEKATVKDDKMDAG